MTSSPNPVAREQGKGQNFTQVDTQSAFAAAIRETFARIRPQRILETGTYQGVGTTLTMLQALRDLSLPTDGFRSIEVNAQHHATAAANLRDRGFAGVQLLRGLSVPRRLLPDAETIRRETLTHVEFADVFIDHDPAMRVHYYMKETAHPDAPEDLIGAVLAAFDHRPDFVLLDSAGHMGFVEFTYVLSLLKGPCTIALDDVYHIKHHRSLRSMQADSRFAIRTLSREKFGFVVADYTP